MDMSGGQIATGLSAVTITWDVVLYRVRGKLTTSESGPVQVGLEGPTFGHHGTCFQESSEALGPLPWQ